MPSDLVLVTGATGYIGGRLVPELLEAGYRVRCLVRSPGKLAGEPWLDRVEVIEGSLTEADVVASALEGCSATYYLVHSMGGKADFATHDRQVAQTFREAADATPGLQQIVYLGGLGDESDAELSPHLTSRHEVGRVLAAGSVPVTELRAAVIIGSGSASFEMLRNLTDVLPVMVTPRWVSTRCQPVAIRDILHWLVASLRTPEARGRVLEVGGPEVVTYEEMMRTYAEVAGLRRRLVLRVPLLTPRLSSHWVGLVTPLPLGLARPLIDSLVNEVVVRDDALQQTMPHDPLPFREAVELAVRRVSDLAVPSRWSDATLPGRTPADPLPTDPDWAGGTLLSDEQSATTAADPEALYRVVSGIGGDRGWYVTDWLWGIRGTIDVLIGGVGMRRGRRHPDDLREGDALDFWRVEVADAPHLLRLRAEMRLPGDAWLEWRIDAEGNGSVLHQRALFHPRGLPGRLYWYALVPFHALIFKRLCQRLADAAAAG
ncbi:MAG: SDR family oxidoreductase [Acidimicrobiales bacterium]